MNNEIKRIRMIVNTCRLSKVVSVIKISVKLVYKTVARTSRYYESVYNVVARTSGSLEIVN